MITKFEKLMSVVLFAPIAVVCVAAYDFGPANDRFVYHMSVAAAQESVHRTRPQFASVFASQIPALRDGQVLVQKHLYLAAINVEAKQPAWVVYRVSRADWDTDNVLERNFSTPDGLRDICLEQSDYEQSGFDLGHLYGLQFVSASHYASEVNQLCAIAAQRPSLNRGPWLRVENMIKEASKAKTIEVIAGQLWLKEMPKLPAAEESHKIASHCWIIYGDGKTEEAYLFPQNVEISERVDSYKMDPSELRKRVSQEWWSEK